MLSRLTIPFILVGAFVAGITQTFSSGPWWFIYRWYNAESCRQNIWVNALYLNNLWFPNDLACVGQVRKKATK